MPFVSTAEKDVDAQVAADKAELTKAKAAVGPLNDAIKNAKEERDKLGQEAEAAQKTAD